MELGTFAPECCSAYIVLNPNYRKQFIDAVKQGLKDNRFLESFESNKNYPDFSMRYGNTETVVFDLREEGVYHKTLNYGDCILEKRAAAAAGINEKVFINTMDLILLYCL